MIERYSTPGMRVIWSDPAKWERWREVELAVLKARGADVSEHTANTRSLSGAIQAVEREVGHDFVAWLQVWTAGMSSGDARQVHFGLTSSDVVDTALGLAIRDASEYVHQAGIRLFNDLWSHANQHRSTIRPGRTHGRPAEVSSWGLWVHDVAEAADRARAAQRVAAGNAAVCKISGPVGTRAELGRDVEKRVALSLDLNLAETSTQVFGRDRIADWAYSLVALLGVCERFATGVRLGVLRDELEEGRGEDQVGSSSMPQKRNPVRAEKICGLARLGRGYLTPILESVALWEERDISHSSVERVALPDLAALTEYTLLETAELVRTLTVNASAMRSAVHRDYVDLCKHWALCRLLEAGLDRWDAHRRLQDVFTADELEELVGQALPTPEWFLRNAVPL